MLAKPLLLLGLLSLLALCNSRAPAKHPKFRNPDYDVEWDARIVGYSSRKHEYDTCWYPRMATSIRGLNAHLLAFVDFDDLPPDDDIQNSRMEMIFQCEPSGAEQSYSFNFSSPIRRVKFCEDVFPFQINYFFNPGNASLNDKHVYLDLYLKWLEPSFNKTLVKRKLSEIFKDHVKIRFVLRNDKWRIESNSLYLWHWNSTLNSAFKTGDSFPITDSGMDLMLKMNLTGYKPFDSVQLFEPSLIKLVQEAPEFIKNYIDIKSVVVFNEKEWGCFESEDPIEFLTKEAPRFETLKVAQIDTKTGQLHFSRYGLSKQITYFVGINPPKYSSAHICAGMELPYYSMYRSNYITRNVKSIERQNLNFQTYGTFKNECQVIGPSSRQVTFFARSGRNLIICPIICDDIQKRYIFYKENRVYSTNNQVLIELTEDLTHREAGIYRCEAGNKIVTFYVKVFALPEFRVMELNWRFYTFITKLKTMFAIQGEGYSLSCTTHFVAVKSVNLVPEFYLWYYSHDGKVAWKKVPAKILETRFGANVTYQNFTYNKTVTVTVQNLIQSYYNSNITMSNLTVSNLTGTKFYFDHLFECKATVSNADAQRYGIPDYRDTTRIDVIFVERPTTDYFNISISDCCTNPATCSGRCSVEISIKDKAKTYIKSVGFELEALALVNGVQFTSSDVTIDPDNFRLVVNAPANGSLSSLTTQQRNHFLALTPVFRYKMRRTMRSKGIEYSFIRGPDSVPTIDGACFNDTKLCIFSTGFDRKITDSFRVANIKKI